MESFKFLKWVLYSAWKARRVVSLSIRTWWYSLPVAITREVAPIGEKSTLRTTAEAK